MDAVITSHGQNASELTRSPASSAATILSATSCGGSAKASQAALVTPKATARPRANTSESRRAANDCPCPDVSPAILPVSAWRRLTTKNTGPITGNVRNILRRAAAPRFFPTLRSLGSGAATRKARHGSSSFNRASDEPVGRQSNAEPQGLTGDRPLLPPDPPAGASTTGSEELSRLASPAPAADTDGAVRQRIKAVHADRLTPCRALSAQVSVRVDETGGQRRGQPRTPHN